MYLQHRLTTTFDGFRLPFLAKTETNSPTNSKLCFNIRFHLYIHDYILDEPIETLTSMVNTCVPPIIIGK